MSATTRSGSCPGRSVARSTALQTRLRAEAPLLPLRQWTLRRAKTRDPAFFLEPGSRISGAPLRAAPRPGHKSAP
jgi:hypothetical protein